MDMAKILDILENNKDIIEMMIERIEALEETVSEQEETIRGLTVDVGQLTEEQNAYRMEIDELAANVDCFLESEEL